MRCGKNGGLGIDDRMMGVGKKRIVWGSGVFFLLCMVLFFNLGKWLDVTQQPVKSDLVVCLGGGTIERVKRSVELIEDGYADTFLLLGESNYNQPYLEEHYPDLPVIIDESPKNTEEEIVFIKQFMKEHGYKSVLIVTDPPHTRRVALLLSRYGMVESRRFHFRLIGSNVTWWNKEHYYRNQKAWSAAWHEGMKVMYTWGSGIVREFM